MRIEAAKEAPAKLQAKPCDLLSSGVPMPDGVTSTGSWIFKSPDGAWPKE